MKISIIVPVYNAINTLPSLLDSLLNQTYHNLEIILVDNNSKDNSYDYLVEQSKLDKRLIILKELQQGPNYARKTGFLQASGDYVYFCDADDFVMKDAMEKFSNLIIKDKSIDIIIGKYNEVNEKNEIQKHCKGVFYQNASGNLKRYHDIILNKPALWNKIFRRDLITEDSFVFSKIGEDMILTLLAMGKAKKIVYIDDIIYHYIPSDSGLSNSINPSNLLDIITTCEELRKLFKENNFYEKYEDEVEFLIFSHIIYRILRSELVKDRKTRNDVYFQLQKYLKTIPYHKNHYYKKKVHYRIANFMLSHSICYHCFLIRYPLIFLQTNKTMYKLFKVLDK